MHNRPEPFPLGDSFARPVAILEIPISGAARCTWAQAAVEATTLAASHGSTFANNRAVRKSPGRRPGQDAHRKDWGAVPLNWPPPVARSPFAPAQPYACARVKRPAS